MAAMSSHPTSPSLPRSQLFRDSNNELLHNNPDEHVCVCELFAFGLSNANFLLLCGMAISEQMVRAISIFKQR